MESPRVELARSLGDDRRQEPWCGADVERAALVDFQATRANYTPRAK
jgi:hypothetical protein